MSAGDPLDVSVGWAGCPKILVPAIVAAGASAGACAGDPKILEVCGVVEVAWPNKLLVCCWGLPNRPPPAPCKGLENCGDCPKTLLVLDCAGPPNNPAGEAAVDDVVAGLPNTLVADVTAGFPNTLVADDVAGPPNTLVADDVAGLPKTLVADNPC